MKLLLGQKIGMTQLWNDSGKLVAATVIKVNPNKVINQGERKLVISSVKGKTAKPQAKLAEMVDGKKGIITREFDSTDEMKSLEVDQFEVGEVVRVSGVTKGKGFAGTIKRHNFHRGPVSHGSNNVRQPGSIGAQRPQRVPLGQKMPGRMGGENMTVRGNKVIMIKPEEGLLIVSGAIPGAKNSQVVVRETNR